MNALRQLVLTDEQLTLLAVAAGEPGFPGARALDLDEAGWTEVAHSLVARGLLHDTICRPPSACPTRFSASRCSPIAR